MTKPWKNIATAPEDANRRGGYRTLLLRDRAGEEVRGRRNDINDSGWADERGREIWPVEWKAA